MRISKQHLVLYGVVGGLILLSFLATYSISSRNNSGQDVKDKYSGNTYNTGPSNNYKDSNPYGSLLVGFEELFERGVSNREYIYLTDALINYTMYTKHIYNGKLSFVRDSFSREIDKTGETKFGFKFSINDDKPENLTAVIDSTGKNISITIYSSGGGVSFNKDFVLNSANAAD